MDTKQFLRSILDSLQQIDYVCLIYRFSLLFIQRIIYTHGYIFLFFHCLFLYYNINISCNKTHIELFFLHLYLVI